MCIGGRWSPFLLSGAHVSISFHTCSAEPAFCPLKTIQSFNFSHLVTRAQVYPLAFKQGMMLAGKCEGFAHAVAISMPGCNTTQVQRPYDPHVQVRMWFSVCYIHAVIPAIGVGCATMQAQQGRVVALVNLFLYVHRTGESRHVPPNQPMTSSSPTVPRLKAAPAPMAKRCRAQ